MFDIRLSVWFSATCTQTQSLLLVFLPNGHSLKHTSHLPDMSFTIRICTFSIRFKYAWNIHIQEEMSWYGTIPCMSSCELYYYICDDLCSPYSSRLLITYFLSSPYCKLFNLSLDFQYSFPLIAYNSFSHQYIYRLCASNQQYCSFISNPIWTHHSQNTFPLNSV